MNNIRVINEEKFFPIKENKKKIKFLLRYAVLAPSTHNTQPWLFKIGSDYCDIFYNPKKKLPHTDKSDRGLYTSLGACTENLIIAAKYFNVFKKVKLIIKDTYIARVFFDFNGKKIRNNLYKLLIEAIVLRSNQRGEFNSKLVSKSFIERVNNDIKEYSNISIHFLTDEKIKYQIAELSANGVKQASKSAQFRAEIASWMNSNISKKKDGMPGYAFKLPLLPSIILPILIKNFNLGKQSSILTRKNLLSAPIICVISGMKNNKESCFEVGRAAEKIMLLAHTEGLSTTINVGAIEIGDLYMELQRILQTTSRPLFLFSIGYMERLNNYTPRLGIDESII